MMQQVARARDRQDRVQKAGQGDVSAIRDVLDRICGKTVTPPPDNDDRAAQVNVSWGRRND
jgi:hypothetical protein